MSAAERIALSKDEVRQLCRTPIKARQVAFLRYNGIRHYVDGHGWPVVLRASVEGGKDAGPSATTWQPRKARGA
jgi:hypothetical protein